MSTDEQQIEPVGTQTLVAVKMAFALIGDKVARENALWIAAQEMVAADDREDRGMKGCPDCEARARDSWNPDLGDPFWMLEAEDGEWLKNERTMLGTRDPLKALRFPTEQEAYSHSARMTPGYKWWSAKPTEHLWMHNITKWNELARLSAAASPGEWAIHERHHGQYNPGSFIHCGEDKSDDTGYSLVASIYTRDGYDERQHNAAFIVALVNAYRAGNLIETPPSATRLRAPIINDAMIERAYVAEQAAMNEACENDAALSQRDLLRVALEAALGGAK